MHWRQFNQLDTRHGDYMHLGRGATRKIADVASACSNGVCLPAWCSTASISPTAMPEDAAATGLVIWLHGLGDCVKNWQGLQDPQCTTSQNESRSSRSRRSRSAAKCFGSEPKSPHLISSALHRPAVKLHLDFNRPSGEASATTFLTWTPRLAAAEIRKRKLQ